MKSLFGEYDFSFFTFSLETNVQKFIQGDNCIETPALVYGRKHEPIARRKYIAFKKLKQNERVSVRECGIFICKKWISWSQSRWLKFQVNLTLAVNGY